MLPENDTIALIKSILSREAINDVQIRAEIVNFNMIRIILILFIYPLTEANICR